MKTFFAELYTPDKKFFSGEIVSLSVTLPDGTIEVLGGHMPAICELAPGKCSMKFEDGKRRVFASSEGMLNIQRDCVSMTSVFLEWEEDLEKAIAEWEKRMAEEIERRKESFAEYQQGVINLRRLCINLSRKKRDDI